MFLNEIYGRTNDCRRFQQKRLHFPAILELSADFAEGRFPLAEVCHEVFGCSGGKMATDTGRYRSAVSKSKDPSGLLISVIRWARYLYNIYVGQCDFACVKSLHPDFLRKRTRKDNRLACLLTIHPVILSYFVIIHLWVVWQLYLKNLYIASAEVHRFLWGLLDDTEFTGILQNVFK